MCLQTPWTAQQRQVASLRTMNLTPMILSLKTVESASISHALQNASNLHLSSFPKLSLLLRLRRLMAASVDLGE
jgi:hypothetical protein